MLNIFT